jgi:hypothetical protein
MCLKLHIAGLALLVLVAMAALIPVDCAQAQGSITGLVSRDDLSTPPDGEIEFLGFIRNTDDEIHIQSCTGAGYEGGHWYDDFQNFLDEAVGVPYRYYFFDRAVSQMTVLNKTIPNNSYQEEDIALLAIPFPAPPQQVVALRQSDGKVRIQWDVAAGVTWHVYRRSGLSEGSFFRIDNPAGNLFDPGISQNYYIDPNVDSGECYSYIIMAESTPATYSPASEIAQVDLSQCCVGQVGDLNGIGGDEPSLGDIMVLIDHLFISLTDPECMTEADVNQSGGLNPTWDDLTLVDVMILIDHLFINFGPLRKCSDAGL